MEGQNSLLSMVVWIVIVVGLMYFMMIRPNKKRMDEYGAMLGKLAVGSKIIFSGGIYGVVKKIDGDILRVEIADGVVVEVAKQAVAAIRE